VTSSRKPDLLIGSAWHGVEAGGPCSRPLPTSFGTRIATQGPKLRLKAASAQAIGPALHELATNAGKYGALSNDTGRVDIRWGCDCHAVTMSWTERDGPPVSASERSGFGTIVMKAMAERSLHGAVQLDFAPSGLIWRLTCPAANTLEFGPGNFTPGRSQM
jgi:two-component sensor histidine kinase